MEDVEEGSQGRKGCMFNKWENVRKDKKKPRLMVIDKNRGRKG